MLNLIKYHHHHRTIASFLTDLCYFITISSDNHIISSHFRSRICAQFLQISSFSSHFRARIGGILSNLIILSQFYLILQHFEPHFHQILPQNCNRFHFYKQFYMQISFSADLNLKSTQNLKTSFFSQPLTICLYDLGVPTPKSYRHIVWGMKLKNKQKDGICLKFDGKSRGSAENGNCMQNPFKKWNLLQKVIAKLG